MIPIRDTIPARRIPIVNYLLILANVYVFLSMLKIPPRAIEAFVGYWGLIPGRLLEFSIVDWKVMPNGGLKTVFSSMFLHAGWMHLIGNMWSLYLFGDNVEDRLGHVRYLLFYILSGLAAMMVHVLLNPMSMVPTIGASGAIAGVMGAYFLLFPRSRILVLIPVFFYPLFFEVPAVVYLFIWFISQLFSGTASLMAGAHAFGGIAFWAHIGGFIGGMSLQKIIKPGQKSGSYR